MSPTDTIAFSALFTGAGALSGIPAHALIRRSIQASSLAAVVGVAGVLLLLYVVGAYPHGNATTYILSEFGQALLFETDPGRLNVAAGIGAGLLMSCLGASLVGMPFIWWRSREKRAA